MKFTPDENTNIVVCTECRSSNVQFSVVNKIIITKCLNCGNEDRFMSNITRQWRDKGIIYDSRR